MSEKHSSAGPTSAEDGAGGNARHVVAGLFRDELEKRVADLKHRVEMLLQPAAPH